MKKKCFLIALMLSCYVTPVFAQSGLNIHIGEDGIDIEPDTFISHYQAPLDKFTWLDNQNIPSEQWPLLFEIARAGNVSTDRVWELRRGATSWFDVLTALNVSPSYFYYDIQGAENLPPPYGKAYGYYRNHPYESVRWSDQDMIGLASVKYISESTHKRADQAIGIYQKKPKFIKKQTSKQQNKNPDKMQNQTGTDQSKKQSSNKSGKVPQQRKPQHENKSESQDNGKKFKGSAKKSGNGKK